MKNKILSLLAVITLLGCTATAASAHPVFVQHNQPVHQYHHRYFSHGQWYDWYDGNVGFVTPGFSLNFNF